MFVLSLDTFVEICFQLDISVDQDQKCLITSTVIKNFINNAMQQKLCISTISNITRKQLNAFVDLIFCRGFLYFWDATDGRTQIWNVTLFHSPWVNGHTQPQRLQQRHSSEVTCCVARQHRPQPRQHQLAPHSFLLRGATYQMHPDMGLVQPGGSANLQLRRTEKEIVGHMKSWQHLKENSSSQSLKYVRIQTWVLQDYHSPTIICNPWLQFFFCLWYKVKSSISKQRFLTETVIAGNQMRFISSRLWGPTHMYDVFPE